MTAWAMRLWLCGALLWRSAAWQYGLVIDAGSGGSRLHLFRWPERVADPLHPQSPAITIPEEVFKVQVTIGISAFAHNVTGLREYMDRLLDLGKSKMESMREHWSLIPIYLKATAGARDLFQDQRDKIFKLIRAYLYKSPFRFETDYWARTLSGEEEGVYAWLTVNAIKGTFRSTRTEDTWGSMDMGGASTQVAFIPHDVSIVQNFFPLHLSYLSIHLYAHSYLEFGYNDANQRLVRKLLRGGEQGTEDNPLTHPCFPAGVRFTLPLREPFFINHSAISVVGSGDMKSCMDYAESLLDVDKPCFVPARSRDFANHSMEAGACSIAGTYEPALYSQNFVAMGQFAKIAKSMGLQQRRRLPLSEFFAGVQRLCAADPDALEFDAEVDNPESLKATPVPSGWIEDPMGLKLSRCWKAIWFWTVLHKGFHFPNHTRQIMFATSLDGKEAGWALGSMAYDVNYYPWGGMWTPSALGLAAGAGTPAAPAASAAPALAPAAAVDAAAPALPAGIAGAAAVAGAALGLALGAPLGALWASRRRQWPWSPELPHGGGAPRGKAPWGHWLASDEAYRPLRCAGGTDYA